MKADKIREMSAADLAGEEKKLQEQLFKLRLQKSLGQIDNALQIRQTRREIARVKTILVEKSRSSQAQS